MADEELMDLVATTDADAFSVLYDRHITAAYSLAYRIAGSQSPAETSRRRHFLSVWRSAQRYDSRQGSVRGERPPRSRAGTVLGRCPGRGKRSFCPRARAQRTPCS